MSLIQFRTSLEEGLKGRQMAVGRWPVGHSANLLELSTKPKRTVLYVKEFNVPGRPGFWGLTKNQLSRLDASGLRWFAVLLLRSSSAGYVLTGRQVINRIQSGQFELSTDGDYKVNENADLAEAQTIRSIQDLIDRVL